MAAPTRARAHLGIGSQHKQERGAGEGIGRCGACLEHPTVNWINRWRCATSPACSCPRRVAPVTHPLIPDPTLPHPSSPQVVQVCAEHKKAAKLQKHLERIRAGAQGMRNPPRILIFANR